MCKSIYKPLVLTNTKMCPLQNPAKSPKKQINQSIKLSSHVTQQYTKMIVINRMWEKVQKFFYKVVKCGELVLFLSSQIFIDDESDIYV